MQILLVEDHLPTAESVKFVLQTHQLTHTSSYQVALDYLQDHQPDLLIIDLNLPDRSGLELCSYYHGELETPRILVLSGQTDLHAKTTALNTGADDYLTKPFSGLELRARVNALLRRSKQLPIEEHTFGPLTFSFSRHTVSRNNHPTHLTPTETQLLQLLFLHRGQVIERPHLVELLWGEEEGRALLDTTVKNLRRKLALPRSHRFLETIYGVGYRLNPQSA